MQLSVNVQNRIIELGFVFRSLVIRVLLFFLIVISFVGIATSSAQSTKFQVNELGQAWAGNSVNTVIFRHHGILTHDNFQFTAFYDSNEQLRVVKRCLITNRINHHVIEGKYNVKDAHNSISLGIDKNGYLHIAYDHHVNDLSYRRSDQPMDIENWSETLKMTGVRETRVTYPTFLINPVDKSLLFLYRVGGSIKGKACMKLYNASTQQWSDLPDCILSGFDQSPWTSNPYWNHPAFDDNGRMHLSYAWRNHFIDGIINNLGIDYTYSENNGLYWHTTKGYQLRTPITQVNSEKVWAVPAGANLINQTSMAIDSHGRPHIVYYANDINDIPQYQHLWFDGKKWKNSVISYRTEKFLLTGAGTLKIPISRPEIVINEENIVYIIFRGDLTNEQMSVQVLYPPDYEYHEANLFTLWDQPLGYAEPIIDRMRWNKENILSMLIQFNHQPDGDKNVESISNPIYIIDWCLSSFSNEK